MVLGMGPRARAVSKVVPVRVIGRRPPRALLAPRSCFPQPFPKSDRENQQGLWPRLGSEHQSSGEKESDWDVSRVASAEGLFVCALRASPNRCSASALT